MTNESTTRNRIPARSTSIQGNNGTSPLSQNENMDEVCCRLREILLSTTHDKLGKTPVILRLKEIVDSQFYNVLTYGICDNSTISTPILTHMLYTLVFCSTLHSSISKSGQVLELYLQCLVSMLRLLSLHASLPGSGTITSKYVEDVHTRIDQLLAQYLQAKVSRSALEGEDFNCQFLFEYALDLISSMASEGSYLKNLLDHLGTISSLSKWDYGEPARKIAMSIRETTPSSKTVFPSSWHSQLRIMETLCLSVKVVSEYLTKVDPAQRKEVETLLISLQRGLITFMQKELQSNGYLREFSSEAQQNTSGPEQAQDQYTFGILYLIQDLLVSLDHSDIHNIVINNSLKIARTATDPQVRSKAFELLASMSRKPDIGQTTNQLVEQCLEYEDWPAETREVAAIQWELMSVKALQTEQYLKRVRAEYRKMTHITSSETTENALSDAMTFSLNKITEDLQNLKVELRETVEIESSENPPILDLGDPSSPISERPPSLNPGEEKTAVPSKGLALIQRLEDVLEECKVMKALLERKRISTPHLLDSTTPPSSGEHKYTPQEVSELLTRKQILAQEQKKLRLEIPRSAVPKPRVIPTPPTMTTPTAPLRISSPSPPLQPKSAERSASQSPHIMTIEEAFVKEEEDRAYRNFCDEEIYEGQPPAVTILEDEDNPPKRIHKPLFGNRGKSGNIGRISNNGHYFGEQYEPHSFLGNSNCRGGSQDVGSKSAQSEGLSWRERWSNREPHMPKMFKSKSERGQRFGQETEEEEYRIP